MKTATEKFKDIIREVIREELQPIKQLVESINKESMPIVEATKESSNTTPTLNLLQSIVSPETIKNVQTPHVVESAQIENDSANKMVNIMYKDYGAMLDKMNKKNRP